MSLTDILAAIRRDTAEAVAGLEAEAAAQRAVVLEQADAEAVRVEAQVSRSRDDDLRGQALRLERGARLDAQRELVAAREEVFQRIVADVGKRLERLRVEAPAAHRRCTDLLLAEALAAAGQAAELEVSPADEAHVLASVAGTGAAVHGSLTTWGGVVVHGVDGRRVDNTLEARLLRADPELRVAASSWLQLDPGPTGENLPSAEPDVAEAVRTSARASGQRSMYDGYEYGNTRLRARMARLLDEAAYEDLLGRTPEALLGQLADTAYGETVEEASARFSGLAAVYYAIRHGLATSLQAARSFYAGDAQEVVNLLASRWDLFNLRTLVRGLARRAPREAMLELLVPAGSLPESVLREGLVAVESVRALFDRLAAWRLPSPAVVPALLEAAVAHDRSGDTVALEEALQLAFARSRDAALSRITHGGRDLAVLGREVDVLNLLVALRVAGARARGEPVATGAIESLPGGKLPASLLQEVSATAERDREGTRARLERSAMPESWRPALTSWAGGGSLESLARALDGAVTRQALSLRRTGDPLGPAIPVAFVFARENEARNLRRVAAGAAQGLDPVEVRQHLVVPS